MANKLSSITTQYRTYKVDQVLTHTQLNESIAFFEDQDRLTRVFLNGVGIVCGFKVSVHNALSRIRITQGVGVTTDGDLLKLLRDIADQSGKEMITGFQDYTHFKIFEDNKGKYGSHFNQGENQIDLWEIIPEERVTESDKPLNELPELNQKVALLYLETFPKEADLCSGIDCDNQGVEQVSRLRVLLTSLEGANHIISKDSVYKKLDTKQAYKNLKKISLKRVLLNASNTQKLQALEDAYYAAISDENLKKSLYDGLETITSFLTNKQFEIHIKPYLDNIFRPRPKSYVNHFQYDYDWLKDVVNTYHEILDLFFSLNTTCLPDIQAFPKHLMLGGLGDQSSHPAFRHGFYPSPITGDKNATEKMQQLLERLFAILKIYRVRNEDIKITPSLQKGYLGQKAIPFYYNLNPAFINNWDYEKTIRNQQENIYRYQRDIEPISDQSKLPLEYDLESTDFYRIEGQQGRPYERAMIEIKDQIRKFNLDFDIKALAINQVMEDIKMEDYKCHFEDLLVLLDAWNDEISCITGKISAFFTSIDIKKLLSGRESATENLSTKTETVLTKKISSKSTTMTLDELARLIQSGKITLAEAQKLYPYLFEATKDYKTVNKTNIQTSISKNIDRSTDSLGIVFNILDDDDKTYKDYTDIKVAAENAAKNLIKDLNITAEFQDAFVNKPIEIIAASYDISNYIPERLGELKDQYLDRYEASIETLCKKLNEFSKRIEKLDIEDRLKSYYHSQALYYTSICCAANKLKILKAEIESRKQNILQDLQLHKFLENHPGLEHQAGVSKGGTFVIVYYNKSTLRSSKTNVVNSLNLITKKLIKEEEILREEDIVRFAGGNIKAVSVRENLKSSLPDKTVIADFMLPYRCCSDCNPINFIVPRPVVYLNLSSGTYCLGLNKEPITYDVIPPDGQVKTAKDIPGVMIKENAISIDPSLFPKEMLAEPISFTVNEESVEEQLTVFQTPIFQLNLPEEPVSDPTVTFSATPVFEDAAYKWTFDDNTVSSEKTVTKTFELPVNEENKIRVSLTITPRNEACPNTVTGEIVFKEQPEEVSLNLEPKEICRDRQTQPIPFEVSPENGIVSGEGVKNTANGFVFDPQLVRDINLGKDLTFQVNGQSTDLKVRVFEKPNIDFRTQVNPDPNGGHTVVFIISTPFPEGTEYIWTINDETLDPRKETRFSHNFSNNFSVITASVAVNLKNVCERTVSETRTIPLESEEPVSRNCIEEGNRMIVEEFRKYQNIISPRMLLTLRREEQEIIKSAVSILEQIAKNAKEYLEGENNPELPRIFESQINGLTNYLMENSQGEESLGIKIIKQLYLTYTQLFYTLIKCQDPELLEKNKQPFTRILQIITQSMEQLKEANVKWDPENQMPEFLKSVSKSLKNIAYIQTAIKKQAALLR